MDGLTTHTGILDRLTALADPARCRLLVVLEQHELSVGELCAVFQLPQSTVSRHLKILGDEGWLASRREGTSRFYTMRLSELDDAMRRLWPVVRDELARTDPSGPDDRRRVQAVLSERHSKSREFFSSAAGQWDRLREELFGPTVQLRALSALLDEASVAGDLGCGTGVTAEAIAPFVRRVIAIDASPPMLEAARERLAPWSNVDVRRGDLEALPVHDGELDVAFLVLVLHHLAEPQRAIAEAHRALKPGGLLLVVDMQAHDREDYRHQMGHVWLGFDPALVRRDLEGVGFSSVQVHRMPHDARAKGPSLFVARARRPAEAHSEDSPTSTTGAHA